MSSSDHDIFSAYECLRNDKSTDSQPDRHRNKRLATAITIRLYAADIGRNHKYYIYGKNVCF